MPIVKQVEVCGYEEVDVTVKEIIEELDESEAEKVIIGLLKNFPNLIDSLFNKVSEDIKLFPKAFKNKLIEKYKTENKSLDNYFKSKS